MNCSDFEHRMQRAIDQRLELSSQSDLVRHAEQCPECACSMDTWSSIQRLYPREPFRADSARDVDSAPDRVDAGPDVVPIPSLAEPSLDPSEQRSGALEDWSSRNTTRWVSVVSAVAAMITIAAFSLPRLTDDSKPVAELASHDKPAFSPTPESDIHAADESAFSSTDWWQIVQHQEWMQQTMPAVKSVREGVAPIGRSLMQAVAILTNTTRGRKS